MNLTVRQTANPSTVKPLSPSGLLSDPADFLQHLLRFQLLESQQRQAQLVLLEEGRTAGLIYIQQFTLVFFFANQRMERDRIILLPVWKAEPSAAGSAWRAARPRPGWDSDCRHWCAPESSAEVSHVCLRERTAVERKRSRYTGS